MKNDEVVTRKEYIEREAAKKKLVALYKAYDTDENHERKLALLEIDLALRAIPAADVAPVRHGRWISDARARRGTVVRLDADGCPVDTCHCSECGDWLTASDEYPARGRYCPNCGAKMDGDDNG